MPRITIEFKFSNSSSCERALYEVVGLTTVVEKSKGKATTFKFHLTKASIKHAFGLLKSLKRLKNKRIYVDGVEQSYESVFKFLPCYEQKLKSDSLPHFCFGDYELYANHNIFGCIYSGPFNFGSIKYGHWDRKNFRWLFNKSAIREALLKTLEPYRCCPAFDQKRLDKIIAALPKGVNPYVDQGWRPIPLNFLDSPQNTRCAKVKMANGVTYFIKGVFIYGEEAIREIAKRSRTTLFFKGLEWFGLDDV